MTEKIPFRLSEPGVPLGLDPAMREYLTCYAFPQPPDLRYGYVRFESEQANDRVGLFGQAWLPDQSQATVIIVHGFAEHAGNYAKLVNDFTEAKFAVVMMDLRGHGLSEGPRGHVGSSTTYVEDLETFLRLVIPQVLPHRPVFLWAHSLGGLTGLQLLQRNRLGFEMRATVLTSPFLGIPEISGVQKILATMAPVAAKIIPSAPFAHGMSPKNLSHDLDYLKLRSTDPLIHHVATPQWLESEKLAISDIQTKANEFQKKSPTLLMLAGDEKITHLGEARRFAFRAYSDLRHKVIEFPGYFHELEKEPEIRDRVVKESIAWFRSNC